MTENVDRAAPTPEQAQEQLEQALFEIRRIIAGQDAMLERVLVCLLAQGHLLIEGVPGRAKTLTIKTTAGVLGGSFARIQFTADAVTTLLEALFYNVPHRRSGFDFIVIAIAIAAPTFASIVLWNARARAATGAARAKA